MTKPLNKKINKSLNLTSPIEELTRALQHERADAENMRRRHEQQIGELRNMVKANVISELLPAIDNLERSLKHVPKELVGNDYVKGVQGVVNQFEKTLSDIGVERIKTVGEVFSPHLHEAVHMDASSEALAKGEEAELVETVSEELQPGYVLGDQVIRHAMVKVKMESNKVRS